MITMSLLYIYSNNVVAHICRYTQSWESYIHALQLLFCYYLNELSVHTLGVG